VLNGKSAHSALLPFFGLLFLRSCSSLAVDGTADPDLLRCVICTTGPVPVILSLLAQPSVVGDAFDPLRTVCAMFARRPEMKSSVDPRWVGAKTSLFKRSAAVLSVGLALAVLCGNSFAQCTNKKIDDPIPGLIPASKTRVKLDTVSTGLISPVGGTVAPGMPNRIFVLDQIGKIWAIDVYGPRRGEKTLFLDVSARMVPIGLFKPLNYDERGLLGLAFHPNFARNGLFYTFTSEPASGHVPDFSTSNVPRVPQDPVNEIEEQSVITEWRMAQPGSAISAVDVNSARELMRVAKPQFNHNGGSLAFGPDGLLYISLGDGGAANDEGPGHVPGGNGQSLAAGNVLGKILRIDPTGNNSANKKYGVPASNPFVGKLGADEIYAYGLRNPYRMSFDTQTGKLWVGDVGQNDIEEIDIVSKGGNYGWPIKEGTFLFDDGACLPDHHAFVYKDSPGAPAGLIDPIAQYDHVDAAGAPETRVSVIAGFVYRGKKIKSLKGRFIFGDYSAEIGEAAAGHMFVLGEGNKVTELMATNRSPLALAVLGWVQDHRGEVYLLANGTGTLNGASGLVLKLKPVDDDEEHDGDDD
jgi:glucose/arabinose dehydrogenase